MSGKRISREKETIAKMIALYQKQCPVHCYQPAKREEMKQIMRWAGPRMLWRHPILTVRHLVDDRRPVPELPEKYRPKK